MERSTKIGLALGLIGILAAAAFIARRRQPTAADRGNADLLGTPLDGGDFSVTIDPRPFEIPSPHVPAPELSAFDQFTIAVGDVLGPAVDQVKDALRGLGLWSSKVPERFRELFATTGAHYRLPPGLLEAVAYRESRFRDDIIDGRVRSAAGAVGIMQIVPRWHPEMGEAGALDPLRAVPYAARYLRAQFERFGTWKQALAAYNWGPANQALDAADKIIGDDWPAETRVYVNEISANAGLA